MCVRVLIVLGPLLLNGVNVECLSMHDSGSYVVGAIVCASGDSGWFVSVGVHSYKTVSCEMHCIQMF